MFRAAVLNCTVASHFSYCSEHTVTSGQGSSFPEVKGLEVLCLRANFINYAFKNTILPFETSMDQFFCICRVIFEVC